MTTNQKFNFFMPAWNRAVKANGWRTSGGLAVVDTDRLEGEALQVYSIAHKLAMGQQRGVTLRDLRHACTVLCLGRDKDTDRLSNDEQDFIVALFGLLANPLDLKARNFYNACRAGKNPGKTTRRNHFIRSRAPEAVLRHLTHDLTGGETKDHESLDDKKSAELARLLAQRPVYGHSPKIQTGKRNYVLDPHKKFEKNPF